MREIPVNTVIQGDCLEVLKTLPDNSVDSIVTDPPAGIAFMGKDWDDPTHIAKADDGDGLDRATRLKGRQAFIRWMTLVMTECLRVLKPGGHMLCWAIPRTSHWTATAIEDAGFEVRDNILHVFGCLSEDSEILTENGWEPYHKLVEGGLALCYDAEHDVFQWQPIEQVYVYPYRDTAYRLRGDHTDQIVSRNHRCLVERGGAYAFEYAEALQQQEGVPVLEDVRGLLQALPLPHQGAGDSEQDVRPVLFSPEHRGQEIGAASSPSGLQGVRQGVLPEGGYRGSESQVLRVRVQGQGQDGRSGAAGSSQGDCVAGSGGVDRNVDGDLPGEDVGREQPRMEGGCDVLLPSRQLWLDEVRSVPAGVHLDGSQGRVRRGASSGGGASHGAISVEVGGGASRQPRPHRQPAGEFDALRLEPGPQAVRASRFTRTDLVRVEPIEYDGIVWCVRVPSGSFVARRAGKAFVTGNSGFPKSLNISKAIDKMAGATRKVVKPGKGFDPEKHKSGQFDSIHPSQRGINTPEFIAKIGEVTEAATPEAKKWEGWGTQLKPAHEVWYLAKKPLILGDFDTTFASTTVLLEAYLWSMSPARLVEHCSGSSPSESGGECGSVRWLAAVWFAAESPEKFAQMGTFNSPEEGSTYWSIVTSWNNILAVASTQGSTSTIGMDAETITALRTLKSYLSRHTPADIIQAATQSGGLWSRVFDVGSHSSESSARWKHIPRPSAPESAGTSTMPTVLSLLADVAESLSRETTGAASESTAPEDATRPGSRPQVEQCWLARKPIEEKNIVSQVLKTGTGGLNIDGARIGYEAGGDSATNPMERQRRGSKYHVGNGIWGEAGEGFEATAHPKGRWPANLVLSHSPGCRRVGTKTVDAPVINRFTDGAKPFGGGAGHPYETVGGGTEEQPVYECEPGCPVAGLDEQAGPRWNGGNTGNARTAGENSLFGNGAGLGPDGVTRPHGYTSASRFFQVFEPGKNGGQTDTCHEPDYDVPFFYTGKASRRDKNADLEALNPAEEGLTNRHPCLHPEALVMTEAGYRPIQTIQIGDKVLSADGCFHEVEQVSQHPYTSESLVEIRVAGTNLTTLASDNHPFLIWRPTRKGAAIIGHEVKWLRADQIEVGDYTMSPLVQQPLSDAPRPEDTDFWFLVGLYLAEGCPHSGGYASFSLHEDEVDLVQRIRMYSEPSKIGVYPKKGPGGEATKGVQVVSFDRDLGAMCLKLCGKGAKGKSIDSCIWGLPEESQRAFLEGYLTGDGGKVRTYIQAKTVSPDIASQIRFLAEKLGYKVELQLCPAEEGGVGERRFKSTSPTYVLRLNSRNRLLEGRKPTRPTLCGHEGATFTLSYVKNVNRVPYQGDVINLSVEGSPTFQTAVGMSHNTVKSQALCRYFVRLVTPPGGIVLDPFAGSGSIPVAAVTEGFKFIAIEREAEYYGIAKTRTDKALGRAEEEAAQRAAFDLMDELPQE